MTTLLQSLLIAIRALRVNKMRAILTMLGKRRLSRPRSSAALRLPSPPGGAPLWHVQPVVLAASDGGHGEGRR